MFTARFELNLYSDYVISKILEQLLPSTAHSQQANSHHLNFFTSERFTLPSEFLYRKDERAPRGTFREVNFLTPFLRYNNECTACHYIAHTTLQSLLLSLYLSFSDTHRHTCLDKLKQWVSHTTKQFRRVPKVQLSKVLTSVLQMLDCRKTKLLLYSARIENNETLHQRFSDACQTFRNPSGPWVGARIHDQRLHECTLCGGEKFWAAAVDFDLTNNENWIVIKIQRSAACLS